MLSSSWRATWAVGVSPASHSTSRRGEAAVDEVGRPAPPRGGRSTTVGGLRGCQGRQHLLTQPARRAGGRGPRALPWWTRPSRRGRPAAGGVTGPGPHTACRTPSRVGSPASRWGSSSSTRTDGSVTSPTRCSSASHDVTRTSCARRAVGRLLPATAWSRRRRSCSGETPRRRGEEGRGCPAAVEELLDQPRLAHPGGRPRSERSTPLPAAAHPAQVGLQPSEGPVPDRRTRPHPTRP